MHLNAKVRRNSPALPYLYFMFPNPIFYVHECDNDISVQDPLRFFILIRILPFLKKDLAPDPRSFFKNFLIKIIFSRLSTTDKK